MSRRPQTLLIGLLALAAVTSARATPTADAIEEVSYLLAFVEHSGCEFYRNGTWYDSKKARAHLQTKYEILAAKGRINSAEEFIDRVATASSVSGQPYQVRCLDGEPRTSSQWLRSVLDEYRLRSAPR